jgi:hypothetical protein
MLKEFKENLEKNNFVFKEITENILWVKDFLKKDEIEFILKIIDQASQADWEVEYLGNLKSFCLEKFGRDDVENLVAEGKFEITQNWSDKNLNIRHHNEQKVFYDRLSSMVDQSSSLLMLSGLSTIQRMQPGVELKSHTDQHTDPSIKYATIVYINDDYADGELFFPNLNISLKPNSGDLLFFPGDKKHEHGVRHVGEGTIRYVVVGFIKEKDHYKKNKY